MLCPKLGNLSGREADDALRQTASLLVGLSCYPAALQPQACVAVAAHALRRCGQRGERLHSLHVDEVVEVALAAARLAHHNTVTVTDGAGEEQLLQPQHGGGPMGAVHSQPPHHPQPRGLGGLGPAAAAAPVPATMLDVHLACLHHMRQRLQACSFVDLQRLGHAALLVRSLQPEPDPWPAYEAAAEVLVDQMGAADLLRAVQLASMARHVASRAFKRALARAAGQLLERTAFAQVELQGGGSAAAAAGAAAAGMARRTAPVAAAAAAGVLTPADVAVCVACLAQMQPPSQLPAGVLRHMVNCTLVSLPLMRPRSAALALTALASIGVSGLTPAGIRVLLAASGHMVELPTLPPEVGWGWRQMYCVVYGRRRVGGGGVRSL